MCRNIRVLHNFQPPTTRAEMREAALQYVRKVTGVGKPNQADEAAFLAAVDVVADATERVLHALTARGKVRTREEEKEKGRLRWKAREARVATSAKP